jgi:hypothetical protein
MLLLATSLQPYCTKAKTALGQFLKAEDILVIEVRVSIASSPLLM